VFRFPRCLLILASLPLAGCNTAGDTSGLSTASVPAAPDRTSIRIQNPDASKWTAVRLAGQPRANNELGWICKPLACAGKAYVVTQMGQSPTRNPDRNALEKAAKLLATQTKAQDMMMDAASEGDERVAPISSRVTEIRGYPAILAESKRTSAGTQSHIFRGHLFVGQALVRVISSSTDRAEAKRHFDSFVTAMEITDVVPSAPPPAPAPSAPSAPVALDEANPAPIPTAMAQ
jgi:hypothetical protein